MAKAKNAVVAGDFNGVAVKLGSAGLYLSGFTVEGYSVMHVDLNRSTVEQYELITDERRKSAASVSREVLSVMLSLVLSVCLPAL